MGSFEWSLPVWVALLALTALGGALLFVFGRDRSVLIWRGAAAVLAVMVAWAVADAAVRANRAEVRRALDTRLADLTARTLVPGSPLGCLDGLSSTKLEAACQKALFAGPDTVAAAMSYIDARLALLADGQSVAGYDRTFASGLERMRRALEADRFGFVAQVLAARGCSANDCSALSLLRNPARVSENLVARRFEQQLADHAKAWAADEPAASTPVAAAPVPESASTPFAALTTPGSPAAIVPPPSGVPVSPKYDFPSSDSIPPVSIMDPEPARPAPAATAAAPKAPPRRNPTRPPAEPQPGPPAVIVPQTPPAAAR